MTETRAYVIPPELQALQSVASKDVTRWAIRGVHFNSHLAVATNGSMMAIAKKGSEDGNTPFPENQTLIFSSAKQAKTQAGLSEVFQAAGERLVGYYNPKNVAEPIEGEYPAYEQVIPRFQKGRTVRVELNVEFLAALSQALNAGWSEKGLVLEMEVPPQGKEVLGPIVVCGARRDAAGIVMPMRTDSVPSEVMANVLAVPAKEEKYAA